MTAHASHTLATEPPVWLITGCSTGFGRHLARLAIEHGLRTVITARDPSSLDYNATKFAVEGLSGALRQEVEPLGIKVVVVEPSDFRTDWAGRSANETQKPLADYVATAGVVRSHLRAISGHQPGDPMRAAQAIVAAVGSENPPRHLLLGNDAFDGATSQLETLHRDFLAGEAVARAADFPLMTFMAAA